MVGMFFDNKERAPRLTHASEFGDILNLTLRNALLARRIKLRIYSPKACVISYVKGGAELVVEFD